VILAENAGEIRGPVKVVSFTIALLITNVMRIRLNVWSRKNDLISVITSNHEPVREVVALQEMP